MTYLGYLKITSRFLASCVVVGGLGLASCTQPEYSGQAPYTQPVANPYDMTQTVYTPQGNYPTSSYPQNEGRSYPDTSNYETVGDTAADRYSVVKGDTLYGISREYGITVDALKKANNITGNLIRPGDSLVIP